MPYMDTWYSKKLNRTFKRGDRILVSGNAYISADASAVGVVYNRDWKFFYGYYTASWTVTAPVCIGFYGHDAQYFLTEDSVLDGGTPQVVTYKFFSEGTLFHKKTKDVGTVFEFPKEIPELFGYIFLGWQNDKVSNRLFQPSEKVQGLPDNDVNWYAVWKEKVFTVTYDANGGEEEPTPQTKYINRTLVISGKEPKRIGYKFLGWSIERNGEVKYKPFFPFTENKDTILYAVWEEATVTVIFDSDGGSMGIKKVTYPQNEPIGKLPDPVKENYNLIGWGFEKNGDTVITENYILKEDITFYAIWSLKANCYIKKDGVQIPAIMQRKEKNGYRTGQTKVKAEGEYKNFEM